jgi:hypothetical protein
MPAFLDPTKPIATCTAESCVDCPAGPVVHCHFRGRELAHFLVNVLPAFVIGGAGIARLGWWWLLPWGAIAFGYFGLLEIRVMCSHCPHYAEAGSSLKCWANYGSPKLWTYRPGPMSRMEAFLFFAGMIAVLGYPLAFLLAGRQWFLLLMYALTVAAAGTTLKMAFCAQCMNFACPLNTVGGAGRQAFFERNPTVAQAWHEERRH